MASGDWLNAREQRICEASDQLRRASSALGIEACDYRNDTTSVVISKATIASLLRSVEAMQSAIE